MKGLWRIRIVGTEQRGKFFCSLWVAWKELYNSACGLKGHRKIYNLRRMQNMSRASNVCLLQLLEGLQNASGWGTYTLSSILLYLSVPSTSYTANKMHYASLNDLYLGAEAGAWAGEISDEEGSQYWRVSSRKQCCRRAWQNGQPEKVAPAIPVWFAQPSAIILDGWHYQCTCITILRFSWFCSDLI